MLARRLRRRPNIITTPGQCIVLAGKRAYSQAIKFSDQYAPALVTNFILSEKHRFCPLDEIFAFYTIDHI